MTKTGSMQIVCLILFLAGLVFTICAAIIYLTQISPSYASSPVSEYSENPYGFVFFTSKNIAPNTTSSFSLLIDELVYDKGSAHIQISADFYCSMGNSEGNSTFFALHVFGNVSDLQVGVNGQDCGKTASIICNENKSSSYLLIEVPKIEEGYIQVSMSFTWKNFLWRTSFYRYELAVPFNSEIPPDINEVQLPRQVKNPNGILLLDETSQARLSVAKPDIDMSIDTLPDPDLITFYSRKVWYLWDIKQRSNHHEYVSTAVSISIEIEDLRRQYEAWLSACTFLLGIGIPLIVSSLAEFLKLRYSDKRSRHSDNDNDDERLVIMRY